MGWAQSGFRWKTKKYDLNSTITKMKYVIGCVFFSFDIEYSFIKLQNMLDWKPEDFLSYALI